MVRFKVNRLRLVCKKRAYHLDAFAAPSGVSFPRCALSYYLKLNDLPWYRFSAMHAFVYSLFHVCGRHASKLSNPAFSCYLHLLYCKGSRFRPWSCRHRDFGILHFQLFFSHLISHLVFCGYPALASFHFLRYHFPPPHFSAICTSRICTSLHPWHLFCSQSALPLTFSRLLPFFRLVYDGVHPRISCYLLCVPHVSFATLCTSHTSFWHLAPLGSRLSIAPASFP